MNLSGHLQRSVGTAWMISFGNTAAFVATFCFLAKDAPSYHLGYLICMGVVCAGVMATVAFAGLVLSEERGEWQKNVVFVTPV